VTDSSGAAPPLAEWTGYLGLLPFLAAFVVVAVSSQFAWQEFAMRCALAYGAVILAFVGAVHFGLCVAGRLAWSIPVVLGAVVPSVFAVGAILLGGPRGLGGLVVGFGLFWLYESRQLAGRLPAGYLSMRRNLSLAACSILALTMFAADAAGLR
jgi:hypothetical protein